MLKVFNYNATDFTKNGLAVLDEAVNVAVKLDLQQTHTISFDYPFNDKAQYITVNNIVVCEGQGYRLNSVTKENANHTVVLHCEGERLFFVDSVRRHIPNVPDVPGRGPYEILQTYAGIPNYTLLANPSGMTPIGTDGVKIDYFSTDKTNPYDVMQAVITAYGKGELYVDNFKWAVVERIGKDNGVRLRLDKNLQNVTVQRQTTELCTRLYPYGKDDLTISTVNPTVYVDSPNIGIYGVIEGYKDYSEYTDPTKLKAAAEWDLCGVDNYWRLDTPQITVSGSMIDLSKLAEYGDFEKISLGDTVTLIDNGVEIKQRVIGYTYYPYSSQPPQVTIGAPSNTNYFYSLWQQGKLLKTLKKNSTTTRQIKAETAKVAKSYSGDNLSAVTLAATNGTVTDLTSVDGRFSGSLSVGAVNVADKLSSLQEQIDELKGETQNGTE